MMGKIQQNPNVSTVKGKPTDGKNDAGQGYGSQDASKGNKGSSQRK